MHYNYIKLTEYSRLNCYYYYYYYCFYLSLLLFPVEFGVARSPLGSMARNGRPMRHLRAPNRTNQWWDPRTLAGIFLGFRRVAQSVMPYCESCGRSHKAGNIVLCKRYQEQKLKPARVTRAAAAMAKPPSRDSSPELSDRFASLTLAERELKARKNIEALELEERVADLEARRDAMLRRREERLLILYK